MTITLFIPCFVDAVYPRAGISMVEILERLGHTVICPEEIACCGQPPYNSGYWEEARAIAAPVLEHLRDAEAVVIGSGSCGAMIKNFYPTLFADTRQAGLAREIAAKTAPVSVALSEAEVHWRAFLDSLIRRGLTGVKLIVSDDTQMTLFTLEGKVRLMMQGFFERISESDRAASLRMFRKFKEYLKEELNARKGK